MERRVNRTSLQMMITRSVCQSASVPLSLSLVVCLYYYLPPCLLKCCSAYPLFFNFFALLLFSLSQSLPLAVFAWSSPLLYSLKVNHRVVIDISMTDGWMGGRMEYWEEESMAKCKKDQPENRNEIQKDGLQKEEQTGKWTNKEAKG